MNFKFWAKWLVLIGALNLGLVAFGFNLVSWVTGFIPVVGSTLEKILYAAIGISALFEIFKR